MAKAGLVGEKLHLRLVDWGRLGEAVAHIDGRTVFVFGGIPGEEVIAEVVKENRRYTAARVVEVLEPSPHRVTPPCPYFGPCTGCQWQHVDYGQQLEIKQGLVSDALSRIGGFSHPPVAETIPSPQVLGYRNHARFTIGPQGSLGFVNRESRQFVKVDRCMLMDPRINGLLEELQGRCSETTQLSIRYGVNTDDFLIQPTMSNPEVSPATGQTHYTESLRDRSFRVASPSFFQVNLPQLDRMVDLVREALQLTGAETVVDAYAGVGTFALLLAPFASKIIAIEDSVNAVEDARANAQGTPNVEFLLGRTEKVLADLEETPHGVILDPPRKGCHPEALEALGRLAPTHVVYVSCDPGTLARDLKILCQGPFYLVGVQPLDMFPQTHHVECVATLALRRPLQDLVLASTSPRRRQLAEALGLDFQVVAPQVQEAPQEEDPKAMVQRLALAKAQKVAAGCHGPVLGADTTVVLDGRALGKPSSVEEAIEMLRRLRGREHRVLTAVALVDSSSGKVWQETCESTVAIRDYSDSEIEAYVASGEAMDKAGAYGVQDKAFNPAQHVEGCYSNVVGLSLCTVVGLLDRAGYKVQGLSLPDQCHSHIQGVEDTP